MSGLFDRLKNLGSSEQRDQKDLAEITEKVSTTLGYLVEEGLLSPTTFTPDEEHDLRKNLLSNPSNNLQRVYVAYFAEEAQPHYAMTVEHVQSKQETVNGTKETVYVATQDEVSILGSTVVSQPRHEVKVPQSRLSEEDSKTRSSFDSLTPLGDIRSVSLSKRQEIELLADVNTTAQLFLAQELAKREQPTPPPSSF